MMYGWRLIGRGGGRMCRESVSRFHRLENVDAVFQLCIDVVFSVFLAFLACYVAQRNCDKDSYQNRHSNAHHYELIVDAAVWSPCKETKVIYPD